MEKHDLTDFWVWCNEYYPNVVEEWKVLRKAKK